MKSWLGGGQWVGTPPGPDGNDTPRRRRRPRQRQERRRRRRLLGYSPLRNRLPANSRQCRRWHVAVRWCRAAKTRSRNAARCGAAPPSVPRSCWGPFFLALLLLLVPGIGVRQSFCVWLFFRSCASLFVINSRFGLGQRNSTPLHLHSDTRRRTLTLHTHNTRRHTRRTHALTDYSLKLTPFRICLNIIALALYFAFFSRFFSSTQTCLIFFHFSQSLLFGSVSFLALFAAVRGSRGRGKRAQPHILGRPWVPAIAADIAVQLFCHKSRWLIAFIPRKPTKRTELAGKTTEHQCYQMNLAFDISP